MLRTLRRIFAFDEEVVSLVSEPVIEPTTETGLPVFDQMVAERGWPFGGV